MQLFSIRTHLLPVLTLAAGDGMIDPQRRDGAATVQ